MRIVITEGGREEQRRAVEIDHQLHGLFHGVGLGDFLLLDNLDARHFFECGRAGRMGLVVAVVIARADIDEADGRIGGISFPQRQSRAEGDGGRSLQNPATRNLVEVH